MIGTTELIVIGGVVLLIFGGKKLPELMKGMGQGVRSFKEGMKEVQNPPEAEKGEKEEETNQDEVKPGNDESHQEQ